MTTRKRHTQTTSSSAEAKASRRTNKSSSRKSSSARSSKTLRRQHLLETLEARQLLAGPQLIGIQPNEGDLIVDGSVRDTAPRVLTFRFDEDQQIDQATVQDGNGIRISRAGPDNLFETDDDIRIVPGLVTVGDPNENEVIVRFAESLPDDNYRIEVFGFDDPGLDVTGLRNLQGELLQPRTAGERSETVDFELQLGALVEAVVPQPVIRNEDGTLSQNRNEIVVYFNEDELFVENDDTGNPTERSAENPRFYQLLFTQETARTTDDLRFTPTNVVYDAATHTARLFFSGDINNLPGVPLGGGTFRLRVGSAVDSRVDLILEPRNVDVTPTAVTDLGVPGLRVEFFSRVFGEVSDSVQAREVRFEDQGGAGLSLRIENDSTIVVNFGDTQPTLSDLLVAINSNSDVQALLGLTWSLNGVTGDGEDTPIPLSFVGGPPLSLTAVGDTLGTAFDVGVFGSDDELTSLVFAESIDPQPFLIELAGGNDDPGHRELDEAVGDLLQHVNHRFGPDSVDGITEIPYNFNQFFDEDGAGNSFINNISERQKVRVREALGLWSAHLGVQFRETEDDGITFAVGEGNRLQPPTLPDTRIESVSVLNARFRTDPTFTESAMVFDSRVNLFNSYGESFLRKTVAGIGLLLGLERAPELPAQTIMSLDNAFLNSPIDDKNRDIEPVFPGNFDILHGQHVHRPDSLDVDLYRFVVDLNDADRVGTLTAETFAERLPESSLLDTTITLFEEVKASAETDFGVGVGLQVRFDSLLEGRLGNNSRLDFIQTDRGPGDNEVRISQPVDSAGNPLANAISVDIPRRSENVPSVPVSAVIDAINNHPFASSIFEVSLASGTGSEDISGSSLNFSPILLSGGGIERLSRNDDYFSEDSRLTASLGAGTYYVGISASGNDHYDPTIEDSGYGGLTQGRYELHLKFEPQVDETNVIRDLDGVRAGVPGTTLDGDGDGRPGGAHNFWFQTRPLNRTIQFTDGGDAVTAGQTIEITSANGQSRTFEFVPNGGTARAGNIPVFYLPTPGVGNPGNLAIALQQAINNPLNDIGVDAQRVGAGVVLTGERLVELSSNFRAGITLGRNIFVDKNAGPQADGSLDAPFNNISNPSVANAFGAAIENDIVRIVGNGGVDKDLATEADNFSYQIGIPDVGGGSLVDGRTMEVPKGVTTMIDAGAVFKLRAARIGVGSSTVQVDRSNGSLQVLGTPRLVSLSRQGAGTISTTLVGGENADRPSYDDGSVIFTSFRDREVDAAAVGSSPAASPGNWGGIVYRRDIDQAEGRRHSEDDGIFLNRVNHAEMRYGGSSNVLIDSVQQLVNPIQIVNLRPTISFTEITQSADAAISAAPDSFEETSYQAPVFQQAGAYTADYDRVGPDIRNNLFFDNSINGLFIRVATTPTDPPRSLTVAGRFDDIDVVHYVAENIIIAAQPGGSIQDGFAPPMSLVSARQLFGGTFSVGDYLYKMTFVDADGFESAASGDEFPFSVTTPNSSIELTGLPQVDIESDYVSRRIYRARNLGPNPVYQLVADLDASAASFIDDGNISDGVLDLSLTGTRGRLDGSLVIDPGTVVKIRGARIELEYGTQLMAEGTASQPVIFTSAFDDRFGAGGTFDTNNDSGDAGGGANPDYGDWSGIFAAATAHLSLDNATVAYAGGISLLEGGETKGFNPIELQQATARITNSRFEFNEDGQDGAGPEGRLGRLANQPSTIFVRGSQPIIVGSTFIDNRGTIIDIDADSLTADRVIDPGRQSGDIDRLEILDDNYGPMIRFNRYEDTVDETNATQRQITGLEIRGGLLTTETIFDDTDIVHLMFDSLTVENFHHSGGLRLMSRLDESLVVKLIGAGTPNSPILGTGFTAAGTTADIEDRIGGTVHVLGQPGAPVVLTSFNDDTVGAGLMPDGTQFTDNNGDGIQTRPQSNDWRSIFLDQYSNDRNVAVVNEFELSTEIAPGLNGSIENAQFLGELAPNFFSGDEVRRYGFEVEGFLSDETDVDTYTFTGAPGTEIWVDIDRTSFTLDTVIELLDEDGRLLARSDNSFAETTPGGDEVLVLDPSLTDSTTSLQTSAEVYTQRGVGGLIKDFASSNPRDAGIHFTLPGNAANQSSRSVFFFRVRSASLNPDDAQGGLTEGGYRFQVRLQEEQEFPGSVVRFSDIRYANHGIHTRGLPSSSPLLGEAGENESIDFFGQSNDRIDETPGLFSSTEPLGDRPQYIGNLVNNDKNVINVGGSLNGISDVDFYQFDINFDVEPRQDDFDVFPHAQNFGQDPYDDIDDPLIRSTIFDIDFADGVTRANTNLSVFFDPDGEFGPELPRIVLHGEASNIFDDLQSPGGEDSDLEKLLRGSASTEDAFIGPVALPEGSYYVAVTPAGLTSEEVANNPDIRLEPINSVKRIVEDRINFEGPSTASPADIVDFFTDANIVASGFQQTVEPNRGHGKPAHFDGSNTAADFQDPGIYSEVFITSGGTDAPDNVGFFGASADLDLLDFSIADGPNIGGEFLFGESENTSTTIPHITINGNLSFDPADFYQFVLNEDDKRVILDIDEGYNPFTGIDDDDDDTPDFIADPNSVDTYMVLLRQNPANPTELQFVPGSGGQVQGSDTNDGRGGSAPGDNGAASFDPFIDVTLSAGTYFIGVLPTVASFGFNDTGGTDVDVDPGDLSGDPQTYTLHVSIEDRELPPGTGGNTTLHFDRLSATGPGTLTSESFDLTDYVAQDLPTFYYNYRYDPLGGDTTAVRIFSNEDPTGTTTNAAPNATTGTSGFFFDSQWYQRRLPLGQFAGHTGVTVEFTYTPGAGGIVFGTGEGLYLDDFIVGFAERGETVFNARGGEDRFIGFGSNSLTETYELELRPGTDFATASNAGTVLNQDFDTNDRHSQSITMIAPAGDQISDGDTFVISDGSIKQEFEFTTTPGTVGFGRTPIIFDPDNDGAPQIAEAIRLAINTQTRINVEAASASGLDTQSLTSARLSLVGARGGSFISVTDLGGVPAPGTPIPTGTDGNLTLPVIFHNGKGDFNFLRSQSQVLIEHNTISDVHAIGIWAEPGIRESDPQDIRRNPTGLFNPFSATTLGTPHSLVQAAPIGNPHPGVARNLPTANDSVIGGLTPGVVVRNNTIDHAGYAGIKVEGETRPFLIEFLSGDSVQDGSTLTIDSGGTRVIFEFEEISGDAAPNADLGSGSPGGDGFRDGHVPVYYRRTVESGSDCYNDRACNAYTSTEMALSLMQSIQGSALMTNDLAELVTPYIGPSLLSSNEFAEAFARRPAEFEVAALYLFGVSQIYVSPGVGGTGTLAPVAEPAQPFARIVNNTVYGADGRESAFPEDGTREANDLLSQAIDTKVGGSHRGPYVASTAIGPEQGSRNGLSGDNVTTQLFLDGQSYSAQQSVTVGNGIEVNSLQSTGQGSSVDASIDLSDTGIDIGFNANGNFAAADFNGFVIGGNFTDLTSIQIEGETTLNSPSPVVTFSASEIRINVAGSTVNAGDRIALTLNFEPTADQVAELVAPQNDVDFYRVYLNVGDRLIADVDTASGGPNTVLKVFDERGIAQSLANGASVVSNAQAPDYLEPNSTIENPVADVSNQRDPFVDFTAISTGTYYVAVSSEGNEDYDPQNLSGRSGATGGTGDYTIGIQTYTPRSFVISLDNQANGGGIENDRLGTNGSQLTGAEFTITQIPDLANGPTGATIGANNTPVAPNSVTFSIGGNDPGKINIPFLAGDAHNVPDVMRAISNAINFAADPSGNGGQLLFNHESDNGPLGTGPISRVSAQALGGIDGDNLGIANLSDNRAFSFGGNSPIPDQSLAPYRHYSPSGSPTSERFHALAFNATDFQSGFGHNRLSTQPTNSAGIVNSPTDGAGTTELFVLINNAAEITFNDVALAAGFSLEPQPGRDADQLINETGILAAGGASPAVLNNVLVNLHESVVIEETAIRGFGRPDSENVHLKPMEAVAVGNAFQFDEPLPFSFDAKTGDGISTGANEPSNINVQNDDFNVTIGNNDPSLQYAEGNNHLPVGTSLIVDSSVNSLVEREEFTNLKDSLGIPDSNILAPIRDVTGILRADNPNFQPPGTVGESVFIDRGSRELADFVGPVAIAEVPRDNDAEGIDSDPAVSFINLTSGIYEEFRIQLRDNGDASDPFPGSGIDDSTVVVPVIDGIRENGANVSLFENDRLLIEGIDYQFAYDETKNIITLTPLAGIWRNDRSYRVSLNNRDRTVLTAPEPNRVSDGDQITITDAGGGDIVFEFETGYQLLLPETISLVVPEVGFNAGGISDGDIFQIDDGTNPVVVFELNRDNATLPDSVVVQLPAGETPVDEAALETFLNQIATNIGNAIQSQVTSGDLDLDVRVEGRRVILGAEAGATARTTGSGLIQDARTLALRVPEAGSAFGGVAFGNTFTVNDGLRTAMFEFIDQGTVAGAGRVGVPIVLDQTTDEVAAAILLALQTSGLNINPQIEGNSVYLNLPTDGSASVSPGQLSVVGLARTAADGDLLRFTPNDGTPDVTFEINRTDLPQPTPETDTANVPINITRQTTASQLASLLVSAIANQSIAGVPPEQISVIDGGQVSIGGESGLGLESTGTAFEVVGSPEVTGNSTIEVFGPLLLNLPLVGGGGFRDGSVLILQDDFGNDVVFEFNLENTLPVVVGANEVLFSTFDTVDILANTLADAINISTAGITAVNIGNGRISLGRIETSRVDVGGIAADPLVPGSGAEGVPQITTQRGIVSDGEVLTIRQGLESVSFEFESVNNGGGVQDGNIAVAFQPSSDIGDVAVSLAAAINNNRGNLSLTAEAIRDEDGVAIGQVRLDDLPGTVVDASSAPTLNVVGVPGGAQPIRISPAFSAEQVKQAIVDAINSVNQPGEPAFTSLAAEDRGGSTFFVENGQIFVGPITSFFLPGIKDEVGNPLEPNRDDQSTQFTILMPTVGLDFGDAPDPVSGVPGRYPTTLAQDGPRHVASSGIVLGTRIDVDTGGLPGAAANGDDFTISASTVGTLFSVANTEGVVEITVSESVNASSRDGDLITIDTGIARATLEFDINGRFDEDNFAIQVPENTVVSPEEIALAIERAIAQSPLLPASVTVEGNQVSVSADDEDGVVFVSEINPSGILNRGIPLPVTVTVTGGGVVDAWIDFAADGDFDDVGDQILIGERFADIGEPLTRTFTITFPESAPDPVAGAQTYARFRVSRGGGLDPTGLALSGEVEDYTLQLFPGSPPPAPPIRDGNAQGTLVYQAQEGQVLQVLDSNGALTPTTNNDDGLLAGIVDADGNDVAILAEDQGKRILTSGNVQAGELEIFPDGTFSFDTTTINPSFNGQVTFTARVTDLRPSDPSSQLVSPQPISVTINVAPINDPPEATSSTVVIRRTINEDEVTVFTSADLVDRFYTPGPANESDQNLVIQAAGSVRGSFVSSLGGVIAISDDGETITYTPPTDYNGSVADTFTYTVADQPGEGQIVETATKQGTVSVSVRPVNDPPRLQNDTYEVEEDTPGFQIPIRNTEGTGILDNDSAGPSDETSGITLVTDGFPLRTFRNGTVSLSNSNTLTYVPPPNFSGVDQFDYTVRDSEGVEASALVILNVGGDNDAPLFVGINGDPTRTSITRDESKQGTERLTFDLTTWFTDPENDEITFSVLSSDPNVVSARVLADTLILDLPPFGFGTATLNVTATDQNGLFLTQPVPITINDTPDPPEIVATFGTITGDEDTVVVRNLDDVFKDPDAEPLTYSVAGLGDLINPTDAQIAQHELVRAIDLTGGQLRVTLQPDAFGSTNIEIAATDGSFRISDTFTLQINPTPDAPVAVDDGYNVQVGSTLQILNPASGLLRNDADADGDAIRVDVNSISPASDDFQVNEDGTFTFSAQTAGIGQSQTFTYSILDSSGTRSNTASVTFGFNQSRYQNPIQDLIADVTADGNITALDALRIINLLNRSLQNNASSLPVSEIGAPPPDYYDVSGDGRISAFDALLVINAMERFTSTPRNVSGEWIDPSVAASTSYATPSSVNLPIRNATAVSRTDRRAEEEFILTPATEDPRDSILSAGLQIDASNAESAINTIKDLKSASEYDTNSGSEAVDEALSALFDEDELLRGDKE